jgi:hypothetical protein
MRTTFNAGHDHAVIGRQTTTDDGHNHAIPVAATWTSQNGNPPHRHKILLKSPTGERPRTGPEPERY